MDASLIGTVLGGVTIASSIGAGAWLLRPSGTAPTAATGALSAPAGPPKVSAIDDVGHDRLRVSATVPLEGGTSTTVYAYGWVSATTNHYDPDAYYGPADGEEDDDGNPLAGHLRPDATPRAMSDQELNAYAAALLRDAYPQLYEAPT